MDVTVIKPLVACKVTNVVGIVVPLVPLRERCPIRGGEEGASQAKSIYTTCDILTFKMLF